MCTRCTMDLRSISTGCQPNGFRKGLRAGLSWAGPVAPGGVCGLVGKHVEGRLWCQRFRAMWHRKRLLDLDTLRCMNLVSVVDSTAVSF